MASCSSRSAWSPSAWKPGTSWASALDDSRPRSRQTDTPESSWWGSPTYSEKHSEFPTECNQERSELHWFQKPVTDKLTDKELERYHEYLATFLRDAEIYGVRKDAGGRMSGGEANWNELLVAVPATKQFPRLAIREDLARQIVEALPEDKRQLCLKFSAGKKGARRIAMIQLVEMTPLGRIRAREKLLGLGVAR